MYDDLDSLPGDDIGSSNMICMMTAVYKMSDGKVGNVAIDVGESTSDGRRRVDENHRAQSDTKNSAW